jgi:uncharacterized protein YdhG (YjbR/CyaY superfamily)
MRTIGVADHETGVARAPGLTPPNDPDSYFMASAKMDRGMAEKIRTTKGAQKSAHGFTAEERAAMRERVRELKATKSRAEGERDVQAKIAEMQSSDRVIAERIHAIIKANAPGLAAKTWYGMPAYAKEDQVFCFFRPAEKFGTRYATLGFSDAAKLDEGHLWPTDFAITKLTPAEEARITALVKRAVS